MELIHLHRGTATLSEEGERAAASRAYALGRKDGYQVGLEHGEQNASISSACWAFAAGAVLTAAILLPLLWPAL